MTNFYWTLSFNGFILLYTERDADAGTLYLSELAPPKFKNLGCFWCKMKSQAQKVMLKCEVSQISDEI